MAVFFFVLDTTHVSPSHAYDPSKPFETEDTEASEALGNGKICTTLDNEKHSVVVHEINEQQTHSNQNGTMAAISSDSSVQQENRSYASIVSSCPLDMHYYFHLTFMLHFLSDLYA